MSRLRLAGYAVAAALALVAYFHGLSGEHIPKNGDEYPYTHIARLTAASSHLLPLRSELPGMRNTKPPLLFWQGIASTGGGRWWTRWNLRWPSVVYTLLTAGFVFLLGRRLGNDPETGLLAALSFLAFFSTYRYGRPFLTNAPEVFWLFIPFFVLLYWWPASLASRLAVPAVMGVAAGIGLLYKSMALSVPIGLALGSWYLYARKGRIGEFLAHDLGKVASVLSIALALFGMWFLFDPDPGGVWNEFVLRENAGKVVLSGSYLPGLLWGNSSVLALALGLPLNAGLLALPIVALAASSWRRRRELDNVEKLLWLQVITFFVAFSIPSQRSSRYLLPVMPALAILLALRWKRIDRRVFGATLVIAGLAVAAMAVLAVRLQQTLPGPPPYGAGHWAVFLLTGAVVLVALLVPATRRPGLFAAVFLVFLSFSLLLTPLDGPRGRFDPEVQRFARGREVWVPVDFIAKEEGHRFLLPGARVRAYREERGTPVQDILHRYPLVVVRLRRAASVGGGHRTVGERLDLQGRHGAAEIREMLAGDVLEHLLVREVLVEANRSTEITEAPRLDRAVQR
ncbi:MAG TPA: phospholipid carrier-dependent glycosyltransferase [Vicinamibacteria bacterium]